MRRRIALLVLVVACSLLALDAVAGAATKPVGRRGIDVVQVEGYLDAPNVSLVLDAIHEANDSRATLLILQLDSSGAIDTNIETVVRAINRSRVPIAVWVGPSGADAKGAATILLEAAHVAYVSPGSGAGPGHPVRLDDPDAGTRAGVADRLAVLAARNGRDPDGARKLAGARLGSAAASSVGATNGVRPTVGEVIVQLDGKTVTTAAGPVKLSTAKVIGTGTGRRRQPNQDVVFNRLGLGDSLLHRLISPSIAYFLVVAGLALIVFEFYTASIGLAGLVGALCVVGAFVGFSHLPVHWWALALLFLSMFGFAIDVQAGGLGPWTFIGTASLVTGSLVPVRRRLATPPGVVGVPRGHRGDVVVHARRHDRHDPGALLDADGGPRGNDRRGRHRRGRGRSRRRGADPRRPLAGPDQPGHTDPGRRPGEGGGRRGPRARGRAARGRGAGLPRTGAEPEGQAPHLTGPDGGCGPAPCEPGRDRSRFRAARHSKGEGVRDRPHIATVAHTCRVPGAGDRPVLPALEQRTARRPRRP